MKVVIIKPKSEKSIRVETELTAEAVQRALAFEPRATQIVGEEGETLFQLNVSKCTNPTLGRRGVSLGYKDAKTLLTQTIRVSASSESEFVATVAKAQNQLAIVEKQINTALEGLAKAEKEITEV